MAIDQILANLVELIGSLQKTGWDVQGKVNLKALREHGVAVPRLLVREQQLATAWGDIALARHGRSWMIDLYSAPRDVCKAVHLRADKIPGVVRIAASAAARDEASVPVTAERAELACSNPDSDIIRIITGDAPGRGGSSAPPPTIDRLLTQLTEFIGSLDKVSEYPEGRVTLQVLRKLGVAVPSIFVRDQQLAWPWGEVTLTRSGREWVLDLHSAPEAVCKAIQLGANGIPGIGRIATSSFAKDEATIPVTAEHADAACANPKSDALRIIMTDTPVSR
jgi:predicted secreted protein